MKNYLILLVLVFSCNAAFSQCEINASPSMNSDAKNDRITPRSEFRFPELKAGDNMVLVRSKSIGILHPRRTESVCN